MFSVITNIYNKKTKHRKTEKVFFWQLEMLDVCTTGDTAHTDTIFKFLPHTRQLMLPRVSIDVCHVTRGAHIEHL